MVHKSVLLNEVIEGLQIQPNDIFLDGTINGGGHSEEAAKILGVDGMIVGVDLDNQALAKAKTRLEKYPCRKIFISDSFRNLDVILDGLKIGQIDKALLDLGLSSNQYEESGRGFSFQKNEPLVMTFKDSPSAKDLTAYDIVNNWDEENIFQIILSYGEERFARRVARKIVDAREISPIKSTTELVEVIKSAVPKRLARLRIHPATKTFQALRIAVNDEIGALREGLRKGFERLKKGGRMGVISFHSIEDRTVKNFIKAKNDEGLGTRINKKPIVAGGEELQNNPRSRSAKLRIIEKKI